MGSSFSTPALLVNAVVALLILLTKSKCYVSAFYVPGVRPISFKDGDAVPLKVNALTSTHTQIPRDYYRLPFCKPENDR